MYYTTTSVILMKTTKSIRMRDFFNSAVKTFSLYDNVRSIPNMDGLKPSQRKALFGTMKGRGENPPLLSVERLSAGVAERTDYHHGVGSLVTTIAGMAATKYPGSNNMNMFLPEGQFGSRLTKEAGAGRYIETTISPYFRQMFKKADDVILDHLVVDGSEIEPKLFLPLLPFVLVNGASGTGTGHACEIKSYHPEKIRDAVLKMLDGKKVPSGTLTPWFRGYHGTVDRNPETQQVMTIGVLKVVNTTTIRITELPVGIFLDQYKDHLNKLMEQGIVRDYDDNSSEDSFDFNVSVPRTTTFMSEDELYQKFKLIGRDTENFTVWNHDGILQRFESAEALIENWLPWRLECYEKRRQVTINDLTEQMRLQSEVIRFIKFYLKDTKMFANTGKKDLIELLLQNDFLDYDKLLSMQIWSLTKDRIADLEDKLLKLRESLKQLQNDTAIEMYRRELKEFKYQESV